MIEIYGKPACPQCEEAKTICEIRGLSYTYLQVEKDFTREQLFEQFPQARTFPQVKANGVVVGGINEFKDYIEQTYIGSTEGRL
jgi:glutaredoxin 3